MKKRSLVIGILAAASLLSAAKAARPVNSGAVHPGKLNGIRLPRTNHQWPFRKGSVYLSLQVPVLYTAYPSFGRAHGIPPLQLAADYCFNDHFAIGGYLGRYQTSISDWSGTEPYRAGFRSNSGGIRVSFHFTDVINAFAGTSVNVKKWDFYTTASLGWHTRSWSVSERYRLNRDFSIGSFSGPGLIFGVKYFPVEKLGIFAEAGWGPVSVFGFGISGKIVQ